MIGADVIPTLDFDQLDEFLLEFEEHDQEISVGVMVVGDAAAYGLVWEWGNTRQTKQGPRTVYGPNPKGEIVWLSTQAPEGWISVNEGAMQAAFEKELQKAEFNQPTARDMTRELEKRATAAAQAALRILRDHAPKDSGQLLDSLRVVPPGSALLDVIPDDEGALEILGGAG